MLIANAQLVAENIAGQLERRISFRRAMKQCMQKAMKAGAKGIKTAVSGRLGGADMARTELYQRRNNSTTNIKSRYWLWICRSRYNLWKNRCKSLDI